MRSLIFPEIFYWFVFVYIIIIFLAPYFAKVSETLDKKEYQKLLVFSTVVIIIFDFYYGYSALGYTKGYSLLNGIFFYFVGAYINRFKLTDQINRKLAILIYFLVSMINGRAVSALIDLGKQERAWNMYSYSSPLVMIASIALFLAFVGLRDNNWYKKLRFFSRGTLAVYLITEYWPMREYAYMPVNAANNSGKILFVFLWAIILTLGLSLFDNIRRVIFNCVCKRIY